MYILFIPIYNGSKHIVRTCHELSQLQKTQRLFESIVFIDDGSSDETLSLLHNHSKGINSDVKILSYPYNQGKGYALSYAIEHVKPKKSDMVIFTDVDIPYGVEVLQDMILRFQNDDGIDIIVGNRNGAHTTTTQYTPYRAFAHVLFRLLLPAEVRNEPDTQCGVKAFRGDVAHAIFSRLQTYRWVFDIELFLIARARNLSISYMPVTIREESLRARSNLSFVRHGYVVIRDLGKIYFSHYT